MKAMPPLVDLRDTLSPAQSLSVNATIWLGFDRGIGLYSGWLVPGGFAGIILLLALAQAIAERVPLRPSDTSKAARGNALAAQQWPLPDADAAARRPIELCDAGGARVHH